MAESEEQQVLSLLRRQEAAVARGDAAGVTAVFDEDAVSYELPPPLENRGAAARHQEDLNRWFATWQDGVTTELADPTVMVEGDLAVVFGLTRMRGTKRDRGPVDIWNRRTVVLRRRGAEWRIVHEHQSYPMLMDGSDKAALDLEPQGDT